LPFRFDNAGAGACLKRYSDPSYFKKAWDMMSADKNANLKREKRSQKIKVLLFILVLAFLELISALSFY
jgi:hypothetical protein